MSNKRGIGLNPKIAQVFADDDEDTQQNTQRPPKRRNRFSESAQDDAPQPPSDPNVRQCAEKLAEFVAKHGRHHEDTTRTRNPGNTPFRFLHDPTCNDYKYYQAQIEKHKRAAAAATAAAAVATIAAPPAASTHPYPPLNPSTAPTQNPTAALPKVGLLKEAAAPETTQAKAALAQGDSLAAMEAFAKLQEKKAAQLEEQQQAGSKALPLLNETSFDRRRVTAVYKDDGTRGHHMQDYIPKEELAKLLSKTNDSAAQAHAARIEAEQKIGADNVGHRLLAKMGWKEGEGLGASGNKGTAAPVSATGTVGGDTKGLGASSGHEVKEGDDIYEAYRKRMQLGYKHRPNPLGNPRKSYY